MNILTANAKHKTLILTLLCLGWTLNTLDRIAINVAIIPISKELSLTETQAGFIMSSFFLSRAIMQPIGGSLADRFGSRKVIISSIVAWSLLTIFTGAAWSLLSLIAIRFLCGIGEGSYPSASSVSLAESFPHQERARAKSTLTAVVTLGGVIGTLVVASLSSFFGWQIMFVILGIVGLLLAPLYGKYFHPVGQQSAQKQSYSDKMSLKQVFKHPIMWKIIIIYFGISVVSWGAASWMPSYMVKVRHLDLVTMGALSSIPAILAFLTMLATGWLLDKKMAGREKYFIVFGSLVGVISMYLLTIASSVAYVVMYESLANIGIACALTTTVIIPLKYIDSASIGTASGMMYLGGSLAGVIAPTVMGFLIQQFNGSYNAGFCFLIASLLVSLLVGMTLRIHPVTIHTPGSKLQIGKV